MGKHDMKTISFDPAPDEFYKARINALEKDNAELNREVEALEHKIEMLQGCIAEYNDENNALKAALVRAALREV